MTDSQEVKPESAPSSRGADTRPETLEQARARIGEVVADKYRLEEVVGTGATAHVYRATYTTIGRTVAIKILRREHASDAAIVERFLREARTANRVQHPNVLDVTDIGRDASGSPFLVAEYLEGETLFAYAQRQGGKLSVVELAEILGPVLSAVAEAHDRGVIHRDLKPENVFLAGRRGRRIPKVLDFGISKAKTSDEELTAVGVMMGTPAYMAPELCVSSKDADARTDVWALGVIVFEMLSGALPFRGETVMEVLRAVATTDALQLSDVAPELPRGLTPVVARCLRRDPDERYANARELALDLARAFEEAKPGTVAQWSLRPSAPGAEAEVPLVLPKPSNLPGTSERMKAARDAAAAPPEAPPPTERTSTSNIRVSVDRTSQRSTPTRRAEASRHTRHTKRGDERERTKTRVRRGPRRLSTRDVLTLGGLVLLVFAEVAIVLKLVL